MNSIAYLDISPRQTGKTTRLVKLANQLAAAGRQVIYVAPPSQAKWLKPQMPEALVMGGEAALPDNADPEHAVWFYDEFDWQESVELRAGGYYATTPRFLRKAGLHGPENDLLLRLVQANGEHFERHYWPFDMGDTLQQARECHSPAEFRLLYLGEFLA